MIDHMKEIKINIKKIIIEEVKENKEIEIKLEVKEKKVQIINEEIIETNNLQEENYLHVTIKETKEIEQEKMNNKNIAKK
jgi:hypothetical protein